MKKDEIDLIADRLIAEALKLEHNVRDSKAPTLLLKMAAMLGFRKKTPVRVGIALPSLEHLLSKLPAENAVIIKDNLYGSRYLSNFMKSSSYPPYILHDLKRYDNEWFAASSLEDKEILLEKLESAAAYIHIEEHPNKEKLFYLLELLKRLLLS